MTNDSEAVVSTPGEACTASECDDRSARVSTLRKMLPGFFDEDGELEAVIADGAIISADQHHGKPKRSVEAAGLSGSQQPIAESASVHRVQDIPSKQPRSTKKTPGQRAWDDLNELDKLKVYGPAAEQLGVNKRITINLYAEHIEQAKAEGVPLLKWAKRKLDNTIGRLYRDLDITPAYFIAIEPHQSIGHPGPYASDAALERYEARRERWEEEVPTGTFDLHGAMNIPDMTVTVRGKAKPLVEIVHDRLRKAFRIPGREHSKQTDIDVFVEDRGGHKGWIGNYCIKHLHTTRALASDIVGERGYTVATSITQTAQLLHRPALESQLRSPKRRHRKKSAGPVLMGIGEWRPDNGDGS